MKMINLIKMLFPFNRSLSGSGNLKTLKTIKKFIPNIKIKYFKSGKKVFDWKIPSEWNVKEAWIKDSKNNKIVDFLENNLHVVGYSSPINKIVNYSELNKKLFSLKKLPNAIPYVTSYYKKRWGFCIEHNKRIKLNKSEKYHVFIKSSFNSKGKIIYGEYFLKGKKKKRFLFQLISVIRPWLITNYQVQ